VGQDGDLARTHEGEPGLPRGRSRLPTEAVQAAQRERLLRAVTAAVAKAGYRDVTVADIVRGARVSKAAFYAHFADKEDCFLEACRVGGLVLADRVAAAGRNVPESSNAEDALRASIAAFLKFMTDEYAFARVFYIDMQAAGPRAIAQFQSRMHRYAKFNAAWHQRARRENPDWPAVPYEAFLGLAGATTLLVREAIHTGKPEAVSALEDVLVAHHLAVLAGQRWPQPVPGTRQAASR
jgi:AcrR family transcriptional regulator